MNKYMAGIRLENIPLEKVGELAPREDKMIAEMMGKGVIEKGYVLADLSGAYIIINAEDEQKAAEHLENLPMFPFMRIEFKQIQDMV